MEIINKKNYIIKNKTISAVDVKYSQNRASKKNRENCESTWAFIFCLFLCVYSSQPGYYLTCDCLLNGQLLRWNSADCRLKLTEEKSESGRTNRVTSHTGMQLFFQMDLWLFCSQTFALTGYRTSCLTTSQSNQRETATGSSALRRFMASKLLQPFVPVWKVNVILWKIHIIIILAGEKYSWQVYKFLWFINS